MPHMHAVDWFMVAAPLVMTALLVHMGMWMLTPFSLFIFAITGGGALMGYRWR